MTRYAITGSRRTYNQQVQNDVETIVRTIIQNGDGIVTGSALGVDYIATEIALQYATDLSRQLKLYLPVTLQAYCNHYLQRVKEGIISTHQANILCQQLNTVSTLSPLSIIETTQYSSIDDESYFARNTWIVEASDEVYAFQVNNSKGTQDTIDKAKAMGKPVHLKQYSINEN